ncbi:hypothetical protein RhiTH_008992 [Rhizoctonia solani]
MFSGSTIWRFSKDVASLKQLAAHNFEDILQLWLPVLYARIQRALTQEIDTQVQRVLFSPTHWHALAKLFLHTLATLKHLANKTGKLGKQLRKFQAATAAFEVYKTPYNAVPQMTRIRDIGDALDVIQRRLDKQVNSSPSDNNQANQGNSAEPYTIGQTSRTENAINIPLWVRSHGSNPVTKHLLLRITGNLSSTKIGKVLFQTDRMFSHGTFGINYTSYDVRREHDTINPKSPSRFILLPGNTINDPNAHPFLYARVLGIYHANVRYCGRPPKRMDFIWVRWLDYDEKEPGGRELERLDRVSYAPCRNDEELLDGFGFIDPRNIMRAAHLIPDFDSGTSGSIFAANSTLAAPDDSEHDWNYHYVNRFVD